MTDEKIEPTDNSSKPLDPSMKNLKEAVAFVEGLPKTPDTTNNGLLTITMAYQKVGLVLPADDRFISLEAIKEAIELVEKDGINHDEENALGAIEMAYAFSSKHKPSPSDSTAPTSDQFKPPEAGATPISGPPKF